MLKLSRRLVLEIPELDDKKKKKPPHAHRVRFSPDKPEKIHKNSKSI